MSELTRRGAWYSLDLTNPNEKDVWLYEHSLEHDDLVAAANTLLSQTISNISFTYGDTVEAHVPATSGYTIPVGWWIIRCDNNTRIEIYDEIATTWGPLTGYGGAGMYASDGVNLRLYNQSGAESIALLRGLK